MKSRSTFVALVLLALPTLLRAQGSPSFTPHYVPGVEGIKGASLPPPGFYVRDYNLWYFADRLKDADGNRVPLDVDAFVYANLLRGIWITDWKVLGGFVGMDIIVPFVNTSLDIKNGSTTLYDKSIPIRHYYGKVYVAGDGDGTNPWDNKALWTDDVSFIVGPPWSP